MHVYQWNFDHPVTDGIRTIMFMAITLKLVPGSFEDSIPDLLVINHLHTGPHFFKFINLTR